MPIVRPMFIVSPPRVGTSLLYRCVGSHPDVAYFTRANKKLPSSPRLARLLTRLRIFTSRPRESRWIWKRFHPGEGKVLSADDVHPGERDWIAERIEGLLAAHRADRFVAKFPSFCVRVPWLDAMFPDALFIRIRRDWRAVVSSMMVKGRRDGRGDWFGVDWPGRVRDPDVPPALAAAKACVDLDGILDGENAARPDRFVEVWYEDLCADPVCFMESLHEQCGLPPVPEPVAAIRDSIRPVVDKWRQTLDSSTIEAIRAELGEALGRIEHPGSTQ